MLLKNYPKIEPLDCGNDAPNEVICESFCNKHYLCRCRQVTEQEIDCLIKSGNCNSLEQVEWETNAGSGCGACRIRIKKLLKDRRLPELDPYINVPYPLV